MNPEDMPEGSEFNNDDEIIEIEVPVDTGKRDYKIIPKGPQTLFLVGWDTGVAQSGNKQIVLTIQDADGARCKEWLTLTPSAFWKVGQFAMAIDTSIKQGDKITLQKSKFIGKRFIGVIKHETSLKDGTKYTNAKIVEFKPHPEGPDSDDLAF